MIGWIIFALVLNMFCYHGVICMVKLFTKGDYVDGVAVAIECLFLLLCLGCRFLNMILVSKAKEFGKNRKETEMVSSDTELEDKEL